MKGERRGIGPTTGGNVGQGQVTYPPRIISRIFGPIGKRLRNSCSGTPWDRPCHTNHSPWRVAAPAPRLVGVTMVPGVDRISALRADRGLAAGWRECCRRRDCGRSARHRDWRRQNRRHTVQLPPAGMAPEGRVKEIGSCSSSAIRDILVCGLRILQRKEALHIAATISYDPRLRFGGKCPLQAWCKLAPGLA